MRSSATRAQCFTFLRTWMRLTTRPSTRFSRAQRQVLRADAVHGRAQAAVVFERDDLLALGGEPPGQPVHEVNLGADGEAGPLRAPLRPERSAARSSPSASAFWHTSQRHSGWTITWIPGYLARTSSTWLGKKRWCTEQWPFHSSTRLAGQFGGGLAALQSPWVPHRHFVQRNAHRIARVPAQVLVGQEQDALAAGEGPLKCRARI